MGTGAEIGLAEFLAASEGAGAIAAGSGGAALASVAATEGLAVAGTGAAAAAGAGMTIGQSMALSAGSNLLGTLLAPNAPKQIPGTSVLKSEPTAMPEAPGPIQRARKEQDLMRKRTMGRDYTASLSDNLG